MILKDKVLRSQLELTKPIADGTGLETSRNLQDKIGRLMHFSRRREVVVYDDYFEGVRGSLVVPRDELRGGVIMYIHGGGFVCGSIKYARGCAAVLAAECGMKTFCVEYRLAPEHPYPAALDDVYDAYIALLKGGTPGCRIILAGESAGGGLIYSLCMRLREEGIELPCGIIAISPWCDLTLSGESYTHNREADPSLTHERLLFFANCYVGGYQGDENPKPKNVSKKKFEASIEEKKLDPFVSPIYGDLTGMPPSLIFAGGDEMLLSDACTMHDKLTEKGCDSTLVVRDEMWHAYVLYSLSSAKKDYDTINAFVKKCLPKNNERKLRWMSLDNSAKIYPASATSNWNNIYRLSATLKEAVDREVLQSALDVTVRRFPSIAVRLHRGMFWYTLEEIAHAPKIQDEKSYPLVRMPFDDIRHCAFRVLVYNRRIAVEFFHALTDGNGALVFLKSLVAEYLEQKHSITLPTGYGVLDRLEAPKEEELVDEFPKNKAPVGKPRSENDSYRIMGTPEEDGFCHVTTFMLRSEELLELAHKNGVSVTAALTAAFIKATIRLQNIDVPVVKRQKRVKMLIPVDLRRIYGSKTLRNFALYVTPGVDPRLGEYSFSELCEIVHHKMKLDITKKNMSARIYTNVKDEESMLLKIAPLFLKNLVMRFVFRLFGEKKSTLSLSNLGVVKLPEGMAEYIERFDFVLSVQSDAPYNAGIISFGDMLHLSIIRDIVEPRLETALYNVLREEGIHVKLESNEH